MFIIELIKAFTGAKKKEEKIPVKVTKVDINRLPKDSQDWIRRVYNAKNGIKNAAE